jgi:hypothetical protein
VVAAESRVAYYPPCVRRFAGPLREFLSSIVTPLVDGLLVFVPFRSRSTNELEKNRRTRSPLVPELPQRRPRIVEQAKPSCGLYASEEQENYEDQHDEAETAAGIVSPTAAVGPGWQRPESYQKQDYNQNG